MTRSTPRRAAGSRPRSATRLLALAAVAAWATQAEADDALSYNRDIRPILAENCFACHGPDSAARKAELRLVRRDAAVEAGAIAPGDPDGSELVFRVESDDRETVMPPPKSGKTLTDAQKETLRRWIADGAEYQPHWSLIAPTRTEPPPVKDESWVRNPIDRFILAKLEANGLKPAPEADRRTLARRAALDLTGLPPEPTDVEAFVNDPAPDAYEKYVESLMRSPRWGEHRARTWLDAARYADTHGYHFDNFREMWSYRDWVIAAFNRNMPFDEFIVEQLAGDLLPDATLDQKIASGFNRCNMTTNEGGTIPEENLVNYTRDRTETFGQVFLGVTTGCAVCHDHKFDPLSQREFYELAAYFNNTTQGALDGNIKDTPPIVFVPDPEDGPRWSAVQTELADVNGQIEQRKASARPEFDSWLAAQSPETLSAMAPADDLRLHALLGPRDAAPTPIPALVDAAAGDFEKDQGFAVAVWVKLAPNQTGSIVARMDDQHDYRGWDLWVEGNRVGMHVIHKWQDDALKAVTDEAIAPGRWTHVLATYDGSGKASGVKVYIDGQPRPTRPQADALKNTIKTDVPLKVGQRHTTGRLDGAQLGDVRLYGHALAPDAAARLAGAGRASALLALPADQRPADELDALFAWWAATLDSASQELIARRAMLQQEQEALKARGTIAHVMHEKADPAMAFVLFRGDYDKRRDQVSPGTPAALPPMPEDLPRNRLGLARWLLRPEHPLTARVAVNRFWQEVFGTGLVRTAGDFGVSGELPSHPELLDWLAVEFRESGWDVQHLFRLMVTSAAYRQSAAASPEAVEKDPQNRLLARGPRFRMDAEMVRDTALAASGLLVEKLGGPSVKPYQPDGVWEAVAMPESNTRLYTQDHGEKLYRRSLYTFWKRAAPPASMEILNAPNREVCTVRRERTNTPLQALVTLNDPQFVEAARALAGRTLHESCACDDARLDAIALRLLARPLRPEERDIARNTLDQLVAHYRDHPDDAARLLAVGESKPDPAFDPTDLAAWTMLANMLMNLDEVLNK
jgi:mono/diheme cytochrome c family protein